MIYFFAMFRIGAPALPLLFLLAFRATPDAVFEDFAPSSGIDFRLQAYPTAEKYLIETMGGGVALFDFDGDGWLDVFFVNGAPLQGVGSVQELLRPKQGASANRLYRNRGDGTFEDVTQRAGLAGSGYGMGAATGDLDNDGDLDLFVTAVGRNALYRNNGDGTFTEITDAAGVAGGGWSASALFVDYNQDGFLDLYVVRYVNWDFNNNPYCGDRKPGYRSYCHPKEFSGVPDLLYRNNGDGTFSDVSQAAGIALEEGKGLGVAAADANGDGWIDLYVANDSVRSFLFENNRDGTFTETGLFAGVGYDGEGKTFAGMGVDFQDYDNDGDPDLVVTNLSDEIYLVYENNGDGTFNDLRYASGMARTTLPYAGWGVRFFDYDHDGWKDLLTANSHVMDTVHLYHSHLQYRQPLLLFRNRGNQEFEDVSSRSGPVFQRPLAARGLAVGDLDNDGDLDVVISNLDGPPLLLRNQVGQNRNWLVLSLQGKLSNRLGLGARVRVRTKGHTQTAWSTTGSSYLSASTPLLHFGLADARQVEEVEILWPSGIRQILPSLPANQRLQVVETQQTP